MTADTVESVAATLDGDAIGSLDLSDLAPAEALCDAGIDQDEGFWSAFDGVKLFWQSWEPVGGPDRGSVALMHGFGEHSSRYDHVAAALCRAGYGVMAIDARGHGRSTGKRAHVDRYDNYVRDFDLLKMHVQVEWPELDLFCLGHSNGGFIVLRYALGQPADVAGFVVTSPMCGLAVEISPIKAAAGRLMSKVWPSFTMPSGIEADKISHLERVVDQYERDPLNLEVTSARWFTEVLAAQDDLRQRADQLDQPFLFLVAGQDALVDPEASQAIFHSMGSGDREMEVYPELYHEILNEAPWADIVRRVLGWTEQRRRARRDVGEDGR